MFVSFMKVHEPCMQKSFQFCHDNGESTDHNYKYSKLIKDANINWNVFTASYTIMS